jgi:drug/metabolite transporter (DMT)-like permease
MPRLHPVVMNCIAMLAGATVLLVGSLIAGEPHALPQRPETWAALSYLAVVGSVIVFMLVIFVLYHWSASRESYSILIVPVVTTALSAWLEAERVDSALLLGAAFIFAGVYVGVLRAPEASRQTEAAPSQS